MKMALGVHDMLMHAQQYYREDQHSLYLPGCSQLDEILRCHTLKWMVISVVP